jgi:putative ABC transport system permease protein
MWRNYLTVAARALAKSKVYSLINIAGLAIGMAACMALLLYVRFEHSYDSWLPHADRTFQLQTRNSGGDVEPYFMQQSPYRLPWELKKDFPQVEEAASIFVRSPVIKIGGEPGIVEDAWIADPTLFDVLSLPFAVGNADTAFAQSGSVVLTESEAERLFHGQPAMGKMMTVSVGGHDLAMRVTGILEDLPEATHIKVPMVIRLDRSMYADQDFIFEYWNGGTGYSYVRLKPGADPAAINLALPAFEKRHMPPNDVGIGGPDAAESFAFSLANVRDVHLGEAQGFPMTPGNDPRRIATFSIIAALLLGISCINFVNLTTARSTLRAREVALRKVVGARRRQLIGQFLVESTAIAAVGMVLAMALVEVLSLFVKPYLGSALSFDYLGPDGILGEVVAVTLLVGILSGLYPAVIISRFRPGVILRANRSAHGLPGTGRLRNVLVIGQFGVSTALIICTAIIYAQTSFLLGRDLGFQKDGLIVIDSIYRSQIDDSSRRTLVDRFERLPGVTHVVRANAAPPFENMSARNFQRPGRAPQLIGDYYVGPGYFVALGTRMVVGREFSEDIAKDEMADIPYEAATPAEMRVQQDFLRRGLNIIVNESAARDLGWADPADALGKTISADLIDTKAGLVAATIIGVVQDARFRSAREPVEPVIFMNKPEEFNLAIIRSTGVDPNQLLQSMDREWRRLVRDVPMQTSFVDESLAELYERDIVEGQMFGLFAALTTLVACLGLFGLAAFTAERRTKEIGIRKVFGARTRDIVQLLVWQFSRPVVIANVIAWPVAWWLMRDWLNKFDERIALGPTPFLFAAILTLAIAIATVAGHATRVARANPIHALRYE